LASAVAMSNLLRLDVDRTDFGSADHHVVLRSDPAARTETVAVEVGTDETAVGEGEEGGSVPGFHHACDEGKGQNKGGKKGGKRTHRQRSRRKPSSPCPSPRPPLQGPS
jgi:hypothetical protein